MTKTMRFLSMVSLVLAGVVMMGCFHEEQFEILPENPSSNVVIRTTTISMAGEELTRALTEHGVKTFEAGDKIAVIYQNNEGSFTKDVATLKDGDITSGGKSAKITVTLTNPKTDGIVKYYYPASMVWDNGNENYEPLYSEQDGTLGKIASNFDYAKFEGTLAGTELPSGTLANLLAICKFTIKDGDDTDITGDVTRLTIKNGSDVYFINPSSQSNIWVALRPISSGNIDIYAAKTWALYKKTVTGNPTLAANTLTPITVTAPQVPGALSGLFRVNAEGDLAYFSQGNLQAQWDGTNSYWTWKFAGYQHEYIQNVQGNVNPDNPGNGDKIDLFGWSSVYINNIFGIQSSKNDNDYQSVFFDWGWVNIQNGGGNKQWRTPSKSEFDYILNWRNSETPIAGVLSARYIRVQLGAAQDNIKGIVLFPDHYVLPTLEHTTITWNDINEENSPGVILHWDDWGKMEAAGAVFLPSAGYREGKVVTLAWENYPEGCYWTSTQGSGENADDCGVALGFDKSQANPDKYSIEIEDAYRHYGFSVRLIGPWIDNSGN